MKVQDTEKPVDAGVGSERFAVLRHEAVSTDERRNGRQDAGHSEVSGPVRVEDPRDDHEVGDHRDDEAGDVRQGLEASPRRRRVLREVPPGARRGEGGERATNTRQVVECASLEPPPVEGLPLPYGARIGRTAKLSHPTRHAPGRSPMTTTTSGHRSDAHSLR